jgi:hypothetical protein
MPDDLVGGSFNAVGVVAGAFDDAFAGAVAAFRVGLAQDLHCGLVESLRKMLRGERPPGQ